MGIVRYENSPKVSPENAVVCDYYKVERAHTMPRMHYHSFYEIYILISGKRKYFFRNKIIELYPQDILIIKPNDAHRAIPIDDVPYERYVIYIDPTLFSQIEKYNKRTKELLKKGILHLDDSAFLRVLNTIRSIENEQKEEKEKYAYSIRNHIERIIIELLLYDKHIQRVNQFQKNDERLQEALDYIVSNYDQNITIDACAKISCMSKSNFARIFHDVIGTNFKEYINSVRVKKASEFLVETDMSVSKISEKVGYDSLSYFGSIFKKQMNMSPKDYRNKYSKNNSYD